MGHREPRQRTGEPPRVGARWAASLGESRPARGAAVRARQRDQTGAWGPSDGASEGRKGTTLQGSRITPHAAGPHASRQPSTPPRPHAAATSPRPSSGATPNPPRDPGPQPRAEPQPGPPAQASPGDVLPVARELGANGDRGRRTQRSKGDVEPCGAERSSCGRGQARTPRVCTTHIN